MLFAIGIEVNSLTRRRWSFLGIPLFKLFPKVAWSGYVFLISEFVLVVADNEETKALMLAAFLRVVSSCFLFLISLLLAVNAEPRIY